MLREIPEDTLGASRCRNGLRLSQCNLWGALATVTDVPRPVAPGAEEVKSRSPGRFAWDAAWPPSLTPGLPPAPPKVPATQPCNSFYDRCVVSVWGGGKNRWGGADHRVQSPCSAGGLRTTGSPSSGPSPQRPSCLDSRLLPSLPVAPLRTTSSPDRTGCAPPHGPCRPQGAPAGLLSPHSSARCNQPPETQEGVCLARTALLPGRGPPRQPHHQNQGDAFLPQTTATGTEHVP